MCFLCPPVAAGWGAFVSSGSFWPSTERDTVPLWALNEERCLLSGLTRLLGPITHRQHASTIQMLISSSARPVLGLLPKRFDWTLPQSATWTHQILTAYLWEPCRWIQREMVIRVAFSEVCFELQLCPSEAIWTSSLCTSLIDSTWSVPKMYSVSTDKILP